MGNRITVVLDTDVLKKLRHLQAKQIRDSASNVSLSSVVNDSLKKCLS